MGGLGMGEGLSVHLSLCRGPETQITFKIVPPNLRAQKLFKISITHFYFVGGGGGRGLLQTGPACGVGEGEVCYKQTRLGTVSETNIHRPRCAGWRGLTRCIMHRVHTSIEEVEIPY